jgi:hypothetical protein
VTWASILLNAAPGARDGLELDLDWTPTWLGPPCLPRKVVAKEEDILGIS